MNLLLSCSSLLSWLTLNKFARALSTSTKMHGHVIARLFPAVKVSKRQPATSSRNPKPPHACIDPSTLKPGTGHLRYRPEQVKAIEDASWKNDLDTNGNTTLDVYLYPQDGLHDTIHFTMNRDSQESLSKTLTRLEVSLLKKLDQQDRTMGWSKPRKQHKHHPPSSIPPSVALLDSVTGNSAESWDVSALTNGEWVREAMDRPCVLHTHVTEGEEGDRTQQLVVEVCPPTITSVQTYEDFDAHLFVGIPVRVNVETRFADGCSVDWYVLDDAGGSARIAQDQPLFTPTSDLVGKNLAVLITPYNSHHNGQGQEEAYRFKRCIEIPSENTSLQLRTPAWTEPASADVVRVVSYNVLADQNAFQTGDQMPFYPYCSKEILERSRRLPLVLQELVAYQPAIMCLQEVDQIVFDSLFQPVLSSLGWDGYYTMKRHAGTREGCAVFWSRKRFKVIDKKWFNLGDLSSKLHVRPADNDWSTCLGTLDRLLKSQKSLKYVVKTQLGHIVQMVRLQDQLNQQEILVVNTHLFYHPDASHVRLIQILLIARQISFELQGSDAAPHIILCGDFNSSLENAAGKLIVDRHVPANFRDLKVHLNTFDYGVAKATSPPKTDFDFPAFTLPESFPLLRSALNEAPAFTHFIDGFKSNLDHVLTTMESVRTAPMPSEELVTRHVAMPSVNFPSDHVSVLCDLKY